MQSSLVHNAGLPRVSQSRPIRESLPMHAPVAVQSFVPYSANAVCFVHFQIGIVSQSNLKNRPLVTLKAKSRSGQIDSLVYECYGLSHEESKVEGKE
jgi:hypothetical protein